MKRFLAISLIFFLSVIALSACQTETPTKNAVAGEPGYPVDETVEPVNTYNDASLAYPIPEEALLELPGVWVLSARTENGVQQELIEKRLTIRKDGSYEITTASGSVTGNWSAMVNSMGATLLLAPENDIATAYNIPEITGNGFLLTYMQDSLKIEEQFVVDD
jgi:hypothetical protein